MGSISQASVVAVIAVRSQSTRLPNKFKADICGKPMMVRIVENVSQSKVDKVVIANAIGDEPVRDLCREWGIECVGGEERDILGRVYGAVKQYQPELVIRVWGDSPLIHPVDIDFTVSYFEKKKPCYLSVFTSGGAIAVMTFKELGRLNNTVDNPENREWIHKYQMTLEDAVRLDLGVPITVDTQEDLDKVREWYERGQTPDGRSIFRLG